MDDLTLDGNAAAGALTEIFAGEVTVAITVCAGCGANHAMGELRAYQQAPGLVLRCRSCETVQLRMVRGADRTWLDFAGIRTIELRGPR